MYSFEVHSNESACRKKVRLRLEQVTSGVVTDKLTHRLRDMDICWRPENLSKSDIASPPVTCRSYWIIEFNLCHHPLKINLIKLSDNTKLYQFSLSKDFSRILALVHNYHNIYKYGILILLLIQLLIVVLKNGKYYKS